LALNKILQTPAVAIPSSMAVRREPGQALARFPVGVGRLQPRHRQMREWFLKGLSLSGVKPEDVPVELNL